MDSFVKFEFQGTYTANDLVKMGRSHHAGVDQGVEALDYELGTGEPEYGLGAWQG